MPLYVPGYYTHEQDLRLAQHYNFSIQRQLDKSTVLTVAYVGTQGRHIEHGRTHHLWQCAALPVLLLQVAGRAVKVASTSKTARRSTAPLSERSTTRTISQNYTNSSGGPVVAFAEANLLQNSGNSNYNSLQVSAERRARDITYLLSYTYAKSLDNISARWDPRDPTRAYGHSSLDMRHNFVASYNWNLPFERFLGAHRYYRGMADYGHQPLQHRLSRQPEERRRLCFDQHRAGLSRPR